ncbi:MAG: ABC transporter ATP-binding protein [Candidatus Hodarchaeales archaeon]|jgi:ABC-type multidrug transport system fused ATPase/permease subunit
MGFLFSGLEVEDYERNYSDLALLRRIWLYLIPYKWFVLLATVSVLVSTIANILLPQALTTGIDLIIFKQATDIIIGAAIAYILIGVVAFFAQLGITYFTMRFTARAIQDLRKDSFNHLLSLDQTFFDTNRTGRIMARISNDTEEFDQFLGLSSQFVALIALTIGTFIVLLSLSVELTIYGLIVTPGVVLISLIFRKYSKALTVKWRRSFSTVNSTFQEGISGISVAKGFSRVQKTEEKFLEVNKRNYRIGLIRAMFMSTIFPAIDFFSTAGIFMVLYFGANVTTATELSPGGLLLFVLYLQRFYFPLVFLSVYYQHFNAGLAATERVFSLMDVIPKIKNIDDPEDIPNNLQGKIEFRNMCFYYNPYEWIYENFNLIIKPGERIGLVGETGSGKTTLTSLLGRFYDPQDGEIFLDNIPITQFPLKDYRNQIAVVFQDSYLFDTSIEENIRYGKPDATENEIIQATEAVHAHQFIMNLPNGYQTVVGERGSRLSSGQRQLIAFARAIIKNPKILILDEATANVDAYTESLIQNAIEKLMENKTSIVVAHRLSTIEQADRIIVLEKGKIIEEGTHTVLLELNGKYSSLYKTYFEHQGVEWEPEWD